MNKLHDLEARIARLEGSKTASTNVRRSAQKALSALMELEQALESMPSFRGDLADRWYRLHTEVASEIDEIKGYY